MSQIFVPNEFILPEPPGIGFGQQVLDSLVGGFQDARQQQSELLQKRQLGTAIGDLIRPTNRAFSSLPTDRQEGIGFALADAITRNPQLGNSLFKFSRGDPQSRPALGSLIGGSVDDPELGRDVDDLVAAGLTPNQALKTAGQMAARRGIQGRIDQSTAAIESVSPSIAPDQIPQQAQPAAAGVVNTNHTLQREIDKLSAFSDQITLQNILETAQRRSVTPEQVVAELNRRLSKRSADLGG